MGVGKFDREAWKNGAKERADRASNFGNNGFSKPGKGVSYWKLLPPWGENVKSPCYDTLLYFGYKKADGNRTVYKGLDKDCPLLNRYIKLKKSEDPKLQAKARLVKPKRMYLYNAVNATTGELKVLQLTQQVQDSIDEEFEDKSSSFDPFDPSNNWLLKIKRKGTTWNDTKYLSKFVKVESFKLSEDIDLSKLTDLSKIYETFTKEELVALIKGDAPKSKKVKREDVVEESDEEEVEDDSDEETVEEEESEDDDGDKEDSSDDEEFERARKELEEDL